MKVLGVNIPYKRCKSSDNDGGNGSNQNDSSNIPRHFSLVLTCAYVFDLARGGIDKPTKNLPNLFSKESTESKKQPNPAIAIADMG